MHEKNRNGVLVWDALDVVSVTGTIGGAVLVVLGYDLMFASLPIALPVFSLFVGIRRERQKIQARDAFDEMLMEDVSRQRTAVEQVQQKISAISANIESLLNGRLRDFEHKLDRIEATLISTSKNVKQVSGGLRSLPGIMKRISDLQQQTVIYAVSSEFRTLLEQWGTSQLASIGDISNRLKFVEESINRLEGYDVDSKTASSYDLPGESAIDVTAERREAKEKSRTVLHDMKDMVGNEISSILKQLKDNQVDMMQSIRDVRMNPIPQADYAFLEKQLERIESVLGNLPRQLSETFKSEAPTEPFQVKDSHSYYSWMGQRYQEAYSKQFSAISAVVQNLENAIEELKRASGGGDSETSVELDVLEQKWLELRSLMHALSDQIAGVNERMEQIMQHPETSLEFEAENEMIEQDAVESTEASDRLDAYLEFDDRRDTTADAVEQKPEAESSIGKEAEWDVVEEFDDRMFDQTLPENADMTAKEDDVTGDGGEYPPNGLSSRKTPKSGRPDVVSTVGNANVGLELLKKGRLALGEDYGEASKLLVGALEQFESILDVDPTNIQCLGNCGNTLLALGELKCRMSTEMESSSAENTKASQSAQQQLQQESQQFLTLAGQRFRTLLENKGDDKRAYMNWGKALCMRAQLTEDPAVKMQLYDAALVKYEQILSFEPDFVDAMFFSGMALKASSEVPLGSPMDSRNRLNQAVAYFEAVGRMAPSTPLQFEAFQMIQECRQLAGSPTLI